MKKLLALALSLALVLSAFSGCSNDNKTAAIKDEPESESALSTQEETQTELNEEDEAEEEAESEITNVLSGAEIGTQQNVKNPVKKPSKAPETQKKEETTKTQPAKKPVDSKHDSAVVGKWVMETKVFFDATFSVPRDVTVEFLSDGRMRTYVTAEQQKQLKNNVIARMYPTEESLKNAMENNGCKSKEELADILLESAESDGIDIISSGYWRAYNGKLYQYKSKADYDADKCYSMLSGSYKFIDGGKVMDLTNMNGRVISFYKG